MNSIIWFCVDFSCQTKFPFVVCEFANIRVVGEDKSALIYVVLIVLYAIFVNVCLYSLTVKASSVCNDAWDILKGTDLVL